MHEEYCSDTSAKPIFPVSLGNMTIHVCPPWIFSVPVEGFQGLAGFLQDELRFVYSSFTRPPHQAQVSLNKYNLGILCQALC